MSDALLRSESLACGYRRDEPVLSAIDLTVSRGETVALLGPSGSGKSTLLKTLLRIVPALAGTATILDRVAPEEPPPGSVGYIPQGLGLVRQATVLRNVLAGTLPGTGLLRGALGVFPASHRDRAAEALDLLGIGAKAHERPGRLSGGEQRRVAVARALVGRPALLLADEMLSELDDRTASAVLTAVRELQQVSATGVLMVEHDIDAACDAADLVCCIAKGTIIASLPPGPDRPMRVRRALESQP